MNNISIRKMRVFIAAVEERSFSKAALRENISQPAATIIANEIEATMGCELFVRRGSTRKAELTPKGVVVAQTFSRILAGYDTELHTIAALTGKPDQKKRVLIQSCLSSMVTGRWLSALEALFEGAQVSFESARRSRIIEEINAKEAVIGVIDGRMDGECADYLHLGAYQLVPVAPQGVRAETASSDWLTIDGIDPHLQRLTRGRLEEAGYEVETLTNITDISLLGRVMQETGRPAVVPDMFLPLLDAIAPHQTLDIGSAPLHSDIGLITQWGHLAKIGRQKLRLALQTRSDESARISASK